MNKYIVTVFAFSVLLLSFCTEPWDNRFDEGNPAKVSVYELLKNEPNFSSFLNLLIETGYDSVLFRNASFTVFAVSNTNFTDLSAKTPDEKAEIAAFHLSNQIIYQNGMTAHATLKTLNGKQYLFSVSDSKIIVNNTSEVLVTNLLATNGVVHEINSLQLTRPNVLQFILGQTEYSYIADFFTQGTTLVFDIDNSTPIGINEDGQTIYDSVWKSTNEFLSNVADLGSEDELFTMFLLNNTILDTASDGNYKFGYLSNIGNFIVDGILEPGDMPGNFSAVNGFNLVINANNYNLLQKLSNGWIYSLNSFEGIRIPQRLTWEITDISDFDSVRHVKATEYVQIYNQLTDLKFTDLTGSLVNVKYDMLSGPLNNDYLKLVTVEGSKVKVSINLPNILPGKYAITLNAQKRAADGVDFDVYVNNEKISSAVSLNGGAYKWVPFDLGDYIFEQETNNVLTLSILGTKTGYTKAFIDHLIFEPVN